MELTSAEAIRVEAFGLDKRSSDHVPKDRFDARMDFHMECDCVPDLGPSHCHKCTDDSDSVVAWWRALELHSVMAVSL